MVQTSLMLQPLISIGGHLCCQHSKCEAALTYMISRNHNNDTVQHSEITFDHICVDLKKHAQISVDGRGNVLYATIALKLH